MTKTLGELQWLEDRKISLPNKFRKKGDRSAS
jgi:hypothetical protein